MKVYFVRHGETIGNIQNFHQTPETPLSETGREQAKKVAVRLKNLGLSLVYSSTHLRAQNTSNAIAEQLGAPVELWEDLKEFRRPKEVRGKPVHDPKVAKIDELVSKNFFDRSFHFSDEENFYDLKQRAWKVLNHLSEKHTDDTVLCVSHGTFIKVLVANMVFGKDLTPKIFSTLREKLWAENTGITVTEFSLKRGWRLLSWNDTSHL